MSQDIIEFNGKRYDATTGTYLGRSHVVPVHLANQFIKGRVIDGFVRPEKPAATKPIPQPTTVPVKRTEHQANLSTVNSLTARHAHTLAGHARAHRPEHSQTLMRRAIHKPAFALKPAIKTQAPAELAARPASALAHKRSAYGVDPDRHLRALQAGKHQTVHHFTPHHTVHTVSRDVPVIPVRSAPERISRPVPKQPDIFEAAIARATSHQEPPHKVRRHSSKRRRLVNSLAIVAAFVVIGGFVGYLNLPQIEVRVASVEAGFGASIPAYAPTGYALEGGVKQAGGTISLTFRSGDSRYTLTQQSSNWNSQTLLDNTLALNGAHQTVEKNGQTVYIYGHSANAAWVNGGVRYDITGNAQLSKNDITSIATSL